MSNITFLVLQTLNAFVSPSVAENKGRLQGVSCTCQQLFPSAFHVQVQKLLETHNKGVSLDLLQMKSSKTLSDIVFSMME